MDILIVSKNDVCRSRIAKELLLSFGKGIKVFTAGVTPGNLVQESVIMQMKENGFQLEQKPGTLVDDMADRKWAYIITLCPEAEEAVDFLEIICEYKISYNFPDIFMTGSGQFEASDIPGRVDELHEIMFRELFNLWRDELRDNIMPSCTCGANTYCRCE